jgi:hypothetical protein
MAIISHRGEIPKRCGTFGRLRSWNMRGSGIVNTGEMLRLLAVLVLGVACAACGDGYRTSDTDGTPRATPTAHTPAPTTSTATTPALTPTAVVLETATPRASEGTLEGYVHIGPTCPVVREGDDCADRPYEAEMDVVDASGAVVVTVHSDAAGRFSATLAAGSYALVPRSTGVLPYASEQTFSIAAGAVTQIDVAYDSGIR